MSMTHSLKLLFELSCIGREERFRKRRRISMLAGGWCGSVWPASRREEREREEEMRRT